MTNGSVWTIFESREVEKMKSKKPVCIQLCLITAGLLICLLLQCKSDATGQLPQCVPGATKECPCPLDGFGSQSCKDDGSGYGPCACRIEKAPGEACPVGYTVECESYCCDKGDCCSEGNGCCTTADSSDDSEGDTSTETAMGEGDADSDVDSDADYDSDTVFVN
jgi:hypothetical protein